MKTSYDYTGRTIDVSIMENMTGQNDLKITNKVVTGILKLAQIFTVNLVNKVNTSIVSSSEGTTLTENLKVANKAYIESIASIAASEALTKMKSEQADDLPSDEKIYLASVTGVEVSGDAAKIYIAITSESQETVTVIVPI